MRPFAKPEFLVSQLAGFSFPATLKSFASCFRRTAEQTSGCQEDLSAWMSGLLLAVPFGKKARLFFFFLPCISLPRTPLTVSLCLLSDGQITMYRSLDSPRQITTNWPEATATRLPALPPHFNHLGVEFWN